MNSLRCVSKAVFVLLFCLAMGHSYARAEGPGTPPRQGSRWTMEDLIERLPNEYRDRFERDGAIYVHDLTLDGVKYLVVVRPGEQDKTSPAFARAGWVAGEQLRQNGWVTEVPADVVEQHRRLVLAIWGSEHPFWVDGLMHQKGSFLYGVEEPAREKLIKALIRAHGFDDDLGYDLLERPMECAIVRPLLREVGASNWRPYELLRLSVLANCSDPRARDELRGLDTEVEALGEALRSGARITWEIAESLAWEWKEADGERWMEQNR